MPPRWHLHQTEWHDSSMPYVDLAPCMSAAVRQRAGIVSLLPLIVRLKLISLNARPKVLTVKLDLHYWPTWELRRTTDGTNEWERVLL